MTELDPLLPAARQIMAGQLTSYKPNDDAGGTYVWLVPRHVLRYSLRHGDERFVRDGRLRDLAELAILTTDNRRDECTYGDTMEYRPSGAARPLSLQVLSAAGSLLSGRALRLGPRLAQPGRRLRALPHPGAAGVLVGVLRRAVRHRHQPRVPRGPDGRACGAPGRRRARLDRPPGGGPRLAARSVEDVLRQDRLPARLRPGFGVPLPRRAVELRPRPPGRQLDHPPHLAGPDLARRSRLHPAPRPLPQLGRRRARRVRRGPAAADRAGPTRQSAGPGGVDHRAAGLQRGDLAAPDPVAQRRRLPRRRRDRSAAAGRVLHRVPLAPARRRLDRGPARRRDPVRRDARRRQRGRVEPVAPRGGAAPQLVGPLPARPGRGARAPPAPAGDDAPRRPAAIRQSRRGRRPRRRGGSWLRRARRAGRPVRGGARRGPPRHRPPSPARSDRRRRRGGGPAPRAGGVDRRPALHRALGRGRRGDGRPPLRQHHSGRR